MANRCYLYATDVVPGSDGASPQGRLVGIAEHNYAVPIVHKLLLSANPRPCRSSLVEGGDEVALIGDYDGGLRALEAFLARIERPDAQPAIREALEFLRLPDSRRRWLVLEPIEIYDMEDEPALEQNRALLAELADLRTSADAALAKLAEAPVGPVPAMVDPYDKAQWPFFELGLGNFSRVLYYDFSTSDA